MENKAQHSTLQLGRNPKTLCLNSSLGYYLYLSIFADMPCRG